MIAVDLVSRGIYQHVLCVVHNGLFQQILKEVILVEHFSEYLKMYLQILISLFLSFHLIQRLPWCFFAWSGLLSSRFLSLVVVVLDVQVACEVMLRVISWVWVKIVGSNSGVVMKLGAVHKIVSIKLTWRAECIFFISCDNIVNWDLVEFLWISKKNTMGVGKYSLM